MFARVQERREKQGGQADDPSPSWALQHFWQRSAAVQAKRHTAALQPASKLPCNIADQSQQSSYESQQSVQHVPTALLALLDTTTALCSELADQGWQLVSC